MSDLKDELKELGGVFRGRPVSLWKWLGGSKLFFWVVPFILIACVIGTVIPQGVDETILKQSWSEWPLGVIVTLGLNNIFYTWWFLALLGLFGLNLIACSAQRGRSLPLPVWTTHMGLVLIMAGGIVTGIGGQKTRIRIVQDKPSGTAVTNAGEYKLPFEILLKKFAIEYYGKGNQHEILCVEGGVESTVFISIDSQESVPIGASSKIRVLKFLPSFIIGAEGEPVSRPGDANNPALLLEVKSGVKIRKIWVFQNFPLFYKQHAGITDVPDFYYRFAPAQVKQYVSDLEVREDGKTVKAGQISVNNPISWKGFTMYQSSYEPGNDSVSILQVNKDPGVPVVYAGFIVLPLGMIWALFRRRP